MSEHLGISPSVGWRLVGLFDILLIEKFQDALTSSFESATFTDAQRLARKILSKTQLQETVKVRTTSLMSKLAPGQVAAVPYSYDPETNFDTLAELEQLMQRLTGRGDGAEVCPENPSMYP